MSLAKYFWKRLGTKDYTLGCIALLAMTVDLLVLLVGRSREVLTTHDLFANLVVVSTEFSYQLHFKLPVILIFYLILMNRPREIEYFYLSKQKRLKEYLNLLVGRMLILICFATMISSLLTIVVHLYYLSPQNLLLAGVVLGLNLLAEYDLLLLITIISVKIGKIRAGLFMAVFLVVDNQLYSHWSFTFFISNGLCIAEGNYGFNIISGLLICLGYAFLLNLSDKFGIGMDYDITSDKKKFFNLFS